MEKSINHTKMARVRALISQGHRFQVNQAWQEARLCYLSAAELLLRVAEHAKGTSKANWLNRAKSLHQAAAKLEDFSSETTVGTTVAASAPLEQTSELRNESWFVSEFPKVTFKDVAGYKAVKDEVTLSLLYPYSHPEAADYYQIRGGGGILLYGPPGVGKTHFSRAVAGELGIPFFWVKSSDILSKYVGEAEQNIARLFELAHEHQRAVMLIDEVEKLMPARSAGDSSVMSRIVGQFLEEINGFAKHSTMLLLIGNTNVPWLIDRAFLNPQRFGRQIYIPLPDLEARRQILQIHMQQVPFDPSIRLDQIAQRLEGFSGADIEQICFRARAIPFMETVQGGKIRPVTAADLEQALATATPTVAAATIRQFEEYAQGEAMLSPAASAGNSRGSPEKREER